MQVAFAWSLCLSVGVVLLSIIPLTIGRVKAGYSVENMSAPRLQGLYSMNYLLLEKEQFGVIKIVGKVFPYMHPHVSFVCLL